MSQTSDDGSPRSAELKEQLNDIDIALNSTVEETSDSSVQVLRSAIESTSGSIATGAAAELQKLLPRADTWHEIEQSRLRISPTPFESGLPKEYGLQIEHNFESLNRRIEAIFQTDVIRVMGHFPVDFNHKDTPYTRTFEAIGDFVPNLLFVIDGHNWFLTPKRKSLTVVSGADKYPIKEPTSPLVRGMCRYRLLMGKVIDLPLEDNFVRLPARAELNGFDVIGMRANITFEEACLSCRKFSDPKGLVELFADAIERRAKHNNYSAQLFSYFHVDAQKLGGSADAREFVSENYTEDACYLTDLDDMSYVELVTRWADDLYADLHSLEHADLAQYWKEKISPILSEGSEEKAKDFYLKVLRELIKADGGEDGELDILDIMPTSTYLHPNTEDADSAADFISEIHLDGEPHFLHTQYYGNYHIPQGYVIAPDNSTASTMHMIACVGDAINQGLWIDYGSIKYDGTILAPSITPRQPSPQRGVEVKGVKWLEKLKLRAEYVGPVARAPPANAQMCAFSVALNTAFFNDFVREGAIPCATRLYRVSPGKKAPEINSPYFHGIGLFEGQVRESRLIKPEFERRNLTARDLRLRLPRSLIDALLLYPDLVQVDCLEDYLSGRGPLMLLVGPAGQKVVRVYEHGSIFRVKDGVMHITPYSEQWGTCSEDEDEAPRSIDLDEGAPASRGKQLVADTRIIPAFDESQREKHLRFSDIRVFSNTPRPYTPGDWDGLRVYLENTPTALPNFRRQYTLHWLGANEGVQHEVFKYHHPKWVTALKNCAKNPHYFEELTRKLIRVDPNLVINNSGCPAINTANTAGTSNYAGRAVVANRGRGRARVTSRSNYATGSNSESSGFGGYY